MRFFFIVLSLVFCCGCFADELKIVMTEFPPYVTNNPNKPGTAVEIVKYAVTRSGVSASFLSLPWIRAYHIAQTEKNIAIIPIARTPERENIFSWIGLVGPYKVYFFKLANRKDVIINSLSDAKKYRVGSNKGSSRANWLKAQGFKTVLTPSSDLEILMLFKERFELVLYPESVLYYRLNQENLSPLEVEKVLYVDSISREGLYLACNKKTDKEIVEKLSEVFATEDMKKNYYRITNKYDMSN
ncbi:substrate-binding periplasmic protein [Spartinivicinus ruber]|uniref:substrate-binding periplasmic protein n=1 Tax=Spartinivicinus ruber TaxID=2683272 RepID=UPI0013D51404|nr:transporter substrate-binding domain-containing protein [Spartinivicinus ruber]